MELRRIGLISVIFFLFLSGTILYAANPDYSVSRYRVAIFKEEGFPAIGTPASLTAEWLYDNLSKNFSVTYLDFSKLCDKSHLNIHNFDLLILPYGESFPYQAFPYMREYLFAGGGLLNVAGRPFWVPMDKTDGKWHEINIPDPYKEFLSCLGIKYYENLDNQNIGLSVTTSLGFSPVKPTKGNIFPYRIPARDFYYLNTITPDKNLRSIVLIKSWDNPYVKDSKIMPQKWCLIGSKGENNPLNPEDSFAALTLDKIVQYLSFPIIIYELQTDLAAYRQKEKVRVYVKAVNNGKSEESCILDFEFLDKNEEIIYRKRKLIKLNAGQRISVNMVWHPKEFKSDFYKIRTVLKKKDLILDKEENGFVVINKNILRSGPAVQIKENKFIINGKESPILGINYYESKLGELMWLRPNLLRIREDFKSMQNLGINFVRIHYHHSKWFRDYFSEVVKEGLPQYLQVADIAALPSERSLRILDAIIQLAQEQGLVFCMDIFSLVPKEMGNPIGWLGLKERIIDKDKTALQKKFIQLLAGRYKGVPGITWDLWNEPHLEKHDLSLLRNWAGEIKKEFKEKGDTHFLTIGDDLSLYLLDVLDYACIHTYEPEEFKSVEGLSKPVIFQEVWNPAGCSLAEEIKQAGEFKKDFNAFLKTGAAGFIPWQWTRQARLWNNVSAAERWDDELGVCVRDDGSLKSAGMAYSLFLDKRR